MLIVGAGGFAKEVVQVFEDINEKEEIYFYDDINEEVPKLLFKKFKIIRTEDEVKKVFAEVSNKFVLGIGNPIHRNKLAVKMILYGGNLVSVISPHANIGNYDVAVGEGTTILSGATLSNTCVVGKGCLLYYNVVVTHDCILGDYVEVSPNVNILGHVTIGNHCNLGSGCIILPHVKLGDNVIVGAGSVVTRNFSDNVTIAGVPASVIKNNNK